MSILADVLGENLPLVRRFHDPALVGEPASKPHIVYYFASKQQFTDHLTPNYGDTIKDSLGFYDPPKSGRSGRVPAYFFHDPAGQLPVEANLYHEVSHQLLFETAGRNAYTVERRQLLGLRGPGHLFRDGPAATGRFAGSRRGGRTSHRRSDQVAGGRGIR